MSQWVKLGSTTISKQWPAVDNDLSNPQLSRINTKFGLIEKSCSNTTIGPKNCFPGWLVRSCRYKCDIWFNEMFTWTIGTKPERLSKPMPEFRYFRTTHRPATIGPRRFVRSSFQRHFDDQSFQWRFDDLTIQWRFDHLSFERHVVR